MDEKIRQMIAEAAGREHGWKADETRVDEVERLRRPSCSFYTVGHTVLPLSYQANYALIGGDQVAGIGDTAKILDACSGGASAEWWAEIVTRFHQELGAGIVLRDENVRPNVVKKLIDAGRPFQPPTLDEGDRSLSFLVLNPETNVVYQVRATRTAQGSVEVEKTKIPLAAAQRTSVH
jgi:hypothetical protein